MQCLFSIDGCRGAEEGAWATGDGGCSEAFDLGSGEGIAVVSVCWGRGAGTDASSGGESKLVGWWLIGDNGVGQEWQ